MLPMRSKDIVINKDYIKGDQYELHVDRICTLLILSVGGRLAMVCSRFNAKYISPSIVVLIYN